MKLQDLRKFVLGSALGLVLAGVCYGLLFMMFDSAFDRE